MEVNPEQPVNNLKANVPFGVAARQHRRQNGPMDDVKLKALALVCTLTPSPKPSSSELLARQVIQQLSSQGVECDLIRVVDHDIKPGVQTDMGDGDEWPRLAKAGQACTTRWPWSPSSEMKMAPTMSRPSSTRGWATSASAFRHRDPRTGCEENAVPRELKKPRRSAPPARQRRP